MIPNPPRPASSASLVQSTSQLFLGGFPDAVGASGFVGADDLIVGLSAGFPSVPADECAGASVDSDRGFIVSAYLVECITQPASLIENVDPCAAV